MYYKKLPTYLFGKSTNCSDSCGVKPLLAELPEGPSPSAHTWSNTRVMENQAQPKCQPEVWTALSTETRVYSHLKTHLLGWYWIYSWNFKARHSGRLDTIKSVCLAELRVKQHSLSDFYLISYPFFVFQFPKLGKCSNDKHQVNQRSDLGGGNMFYRWAQIKENNPFSWH